MSKEEYLAKAVAHYYDAIHGLKDQKDFYSYEAEFEEVWLDLGQEVRIRSVK